MANLIRCYYLHPLRFPYLFLLRSLFKCALPPSWYSLLIH